MAATGDGFPHLDTNQEHYALSASYLALSGGAFNGSYKQTGSTPERPTSPDAGLKKASRMGLLQGIGSPPVRGTGS